MNSTRQALRQFLEWREEEGFTGPFRQEEARRYLLSRYRSGKKWQTVNGDYSAMRKFYEHVLGQEWDVEHLPRPRKERALPGILSTEEVERLISHGRTLKLPSLGHVGVCPELLRCVPGHRKPLGAIAWLEEKPYIVALSKKKGVNAFPFSMRVSWAGLVPSNGSSPNIVSRSLASGAKPSLDANAGRRLRLLPSETEIH